MPASSLGINLSAQYCQYILLSSMMNVESPKKPRSHMKFSQELNLKWGNLLLYW